MANIKEIIQAIVPTPAPVKIEISRSAFPDWDTLQAGGKSVTVQHIKVLQEELRVNMNRISEETNDGSKSVYELQNEIILKLYEDFRINYLETSGLKNSDVFIINGSSNVPKTITMARLQQAIGGEEQGFFNEKVDLRNDPVVGNNTCGINKNEDCTLPANSAENEDRRGWRATVLIPTSPETITDEIWSWEVSSGIWIPTGTLGNVDPIRVSDLESQVRHIFADALSTTISSILNVNSLNVSGDTLLNNILTVKENVIFEKDLNVTQKITTADLEVTNFADIQRASITIDGILKSSDYINFVELVNIYITNLNLPNGGVQLNASGKIPSELIGAEFLSFHGQFNTANPLPNNPDTGDLYVCTENNYVDPEAPLITFNNGDFAIWDGDNVEWLHINNSQNLVSINGLTGVADLTGDEIYEQKAQVGLTLNAKNAEQDSKLDKLHIDTENELIVSDNQEFIEPTHPRFPDANNRMEVFYNGVLLTQFLDYNRSSTRLTFLDTTFIRENDHISMEFGGTV